MNGKSLTEHITDLVKQSLSVDHEFNSNNKISNLENRLLMLESIVRNREYISQDIKPFTNAEAFNCTNFMRGVFDQEIKKRNIEDKNQAFNDFAGHVNSYIQLSQDFTNRLKEVMLSDKPTPWTGEELNKLVGKDKCNCPIRIGLINWTGKLDCPSQQEICDKGEELISFFD